MGRLDLGGEPPVGAGADVADGAQRGDDGREAGAGVERRAQLDAAGGREELDRRGRGSEPSTARRSLRAADQPIETWSSCIARLGIESTLAGTARRFISLTIAAWVYCAII